MRGKTLEEIFDGRPADLIIADLKHKIVTVPAWNDLVNEYEPKHHPVMDKTKYPDIVGSA